MKISSDSKFQATVEKSHYLIVGKEYKIKAKADETVSERYGSLFS